MLKHHLRRAAAILCTMSLLASMTAAFAAAPQPETVHAQIWRGYLITVDGTDIGFTDQQGKYARPIIYQGSVYIPLQTASEWLGCDAVWDEEARTVTLTSGREAYLRDKWLDQVVTESEEEREREYQQYLSDWENGMDIQLRPDVTVLLDGEAKTFATVNGTPTYPVLLRGEVYLPVRGVGELLGKEVHYLPHRPNDPAWSELEKIEELYDLDPVPTWGNHCLIQIYDTPTREQLAKVQDYIDQALALYDKILQEIAAFRALETMTREEAISRSQVLRDDAEAIRALTQPEAPFMSYRYEGVKASGWVLRNQLDGQIAALTTPGFMTMEAFLALDPLGSGANVDSMAILRANIAGAQERLDEVRGGLEQPDGPGL